MPEKKYAAVITGASGGIGKAVIDELDKNFKLCFNLDVREPEGKFYEFVKTDISSLDEVNKSVEKFTQHQVPLKALVLCAGVGIHEKLTEGDPVKWKKVIEVNLLGALNVIRAYIPFMSAGGDIIFISSVAAGQPHVYGGVYAATKSALNVVAETLRQEVQGNLRITIIEPGLVETDFMKNTISGDRSDEVFNFSALNPETIAEAVRFIIDQPESVQINKLTIRPSGQSF